jgi:hypothetical protein
MTIKYLREMSDVHLEFGPFFIPSLPTDSETVLLLSGDIHVGNRALRDDWLKKLSQRFAYVLYILGNHEHYKSSVDVTGQKIKFGNKKAKVCLTDPDLQNVKLLENETFVIPGTNWKVFGGTMWTDFHRGNPVTMWNAQRVMSDYKKIRTAKYQRRLTPNYVISLHLAYKQALLEELAKDDGMNVIVMSHHAPHSMSVAERYKRPVDYHDNGCYHSDVSDLILDNPKIKFWFHGHMHNNSDYMIGDDCRVICNPRGYHGVELNDSFNAEFMVEL